VTSSYFERLPELADKLQTQYNVDPDTLRQFLFDYALNEGNLDSDLENIYPDAEDIDIARELASVSDFPDAIPFEAYDIDPDYENLNAYRYAAENPKAREFLTENNNLNTLLPGSTVESARDAYLQAVNTGALTQRQRQTLREGGLSRFLTDANYSNNAGEALNNILQAYTDRYDVDYSQNLENVADILEQADEVVRPVETSLSARQDALQNADRRAAAADPLSVRIDRNTVQPGLSLRGSASEIADRYAAIRDNPPQTYDELRAQGDELRSLRRDVTGQGNLNYFPVENSPILSQVEDFITRGASPSRRDYILDRARASLADPNRNSLYDLVRNLNQENTSAPNLLEERMMDRTVNMSPAEIDPLIPLSTNVDSTQAGIPGLEDQLFENKEIALKEAGKGQVQELNKFVEKYPEVGPYLQGALENPTPKIERDLQKLSPYLDLEQEISKPEIRQDIYNLAMKELGVQPSYLSQIEANYTSGDTLKQKDAIDSLIQMGYGEQLQAGSAPAVSKRMPVVGGGGYVEGLELQNALSSIRNRANEIQDLVNNPMFEK